MMEKSENRRAFWWIVLLGTLLIAFIYVLVRVISIIPHDYVKYSSIIEAVLVGIILLIILRTLLRITSNILNRNIQRKYSKPFIFLLSIIGYLIIILAVLGILGVDLSSIILAGGLASVIIGLAAQTVLSNFFGGVLLMMSKPFEVGDRVEINTWQFPYVIPSYPPKFLSRDEFRPAYRGTVEDISMNFTTVIEEDGTVTKLPNSIVIQSSVSVNTSSRNIQIRTEVPKSVSFEVLRDRINSFSKKVEGIVDTKIAVDEVSKETYLVKIIIVPEQNYKGDIRGEFMSNLLKATVG
jgi:small-conductance mechanosensitive channel